MSGAAGPVAGVDELGALPAGEDPAPPSRPAPHPAPPPAAPHQTPHQTSHLTASLLRGASLTTVGAVVNAAAGFVLVVVIARALGAGQSGLLFTATALFTLVAVIGKLGADTGLVRDLAGRIALGRREDLRRLVLLGAVPVVALTGLLSAGAFWAAPALAQLCFAEPSQGGTTLLRVLAVALPFGALSLVAVAASRGLGDVVPLVVVENVGKPVLRVALCVAVGVAGGGVVAMGWAWSVPVLVGCAAAVLLLARRLAACAAGAGPGAPWRSLAPPFWRFSSLRGVASALDVANVTAGTLLVSALVGPVEAAVLAGAMRFAQAGTLGLQALRLVIAPQISRLLAHSRYDEVQRLHQTTTLLAVLVTGPAYVLLALHAETALALLGADFAVGAPALQVLCVAMLVNLVTGNVQVVLLMSGRSGTTVVVVGACLGLNLALGLALVPRYGALGGALAWGAAVAVENLVYQAVVRRRLGIRTSNRPLGLACVLVLGCFLLPGLLGPVVLGQGWQASLAVIACSCAVYVVLARRYRRTFGSAELLAAVRGRRDPDAPLTTDPPD